MVTPLERFAVELTVPGQRGWTPLWDSLNLSTWAQLCYFGRRQGVEFELPNNCYERSCAISQRATEDKDIALL